MDQRITGLHSGQIARAGKEIPGAEKALMLLHGRGGTAGKILDLAARLAVKDFALFAPQATGNSWYPQSSWSIPAKNEPWLSAALKAVDELVKAIEQSGIQKKNIYFFGFSQGASLVLEFLARNAAKFGGVVAFSGALIGDRIYPENYSGDFKHTPFLLSAGDGDRHLPASRIKESEIILKERGADTTLKIYDGQGHIISQDQIDLANKLIFGSTV